VIKVKVYTILAIKEILGQREFEVPFPEGTTVKDFLSWMNEKWGDRLASHIFQPRSHQLLPHIRLMINGRDIQFLNGMETILEDGDEFMMLPLVAGG
jgi:molybdopterin synthase sulfur carrier subunit